MILPKKPKNFIIYRASFPNGKCYIGITTQNFDIRVKEHLSRSKKPTYKFHKALNKAKIVCWEILEETNSIENLLKLESFYIEKFNSYKKGYNSTLGGELGLGRKVSNKTKYLLSVLNKGSNNPNFGKTKSLESRIKCAKSNGSKPFNVYEKDSLKFVGTWNINKQCARDLGLNYKTVGHCLNGRYGYKSHKGYIFKFCEGDVSF